MAENFALANRVRHLIVQPSDAALDPPESYLFVQDGLIISCGVIYAMCYLFCMIRAYSDRTLPGKDWGSIQFLAGCMAYEFFYAFTTTTTQNEKLCFLAWFELDIAFTSLVLRRIYGPEQRKKILRNMVFMFTAGVAGLYGLTKLYPDEREQVTAYWTGLALQLPIGYACLYFLWRDQDTAGHSLEIWLTKYIGCYTAYGVFFWRYWNIPQNWEYVGSPLSVGIIILTLIPETIYPFVYIKIHNEKEKKEKLQ
ncbi:uncharacterized protein ACHE_10151A [Aspergillus chevalieri]|uniref:Uncharacterized protein n=1 Tax=Aspergillus chevalieri TaxID=182096 RepID=A0A7R7VFE4_ASPCH|nr:uncharacterized protein ACHE_10151A [Aspergillus chevalieri]BCR82749.1 hypothetical protein ACHE_10151A [Aspergillus chevalieri]